MFSLNKSREKPPPKALQWKIVTDINYCSWCTFKSVFNHKEIFFDFLPLNTRKMLRLNLLLCLRNFFNAKKFTRAKKNIRDSIEWRLIAEMLWYVQKEEISKCETINSESMCTLIKAKWRKNLDKETRNLFYHFQALFWKMISHAFVPCLTLKNLHCGCLGKNGGEKISATINHNTKNSFHLISKSCSLQIDNAFGAVREGS